MKKIFKLLILFLLVFLVIEGGIKVSAKTNNIHLITTNPGENASSEININYHAYKSGSYIEYTLASDTSYANKVVITPTEKLWSIQGQENADPSNTFYTTPRYVCSASLTNLQPATKYMYHVVCEAEVSNNYYFTTAGLTNTWNFLAFADFQYGKNKVTHPLIKRMQEIGKYPPLVVCSGDMTDVSGDEEEWTWFLDNEVMEDFIYATAPGDHEYWAQHITSTKLFSTPYTYNAIFNNPKNGAELSKNSNFYFYYNNVLFVMLDMDDSDTVTSDRMKGEISWFKSTLDSLAGTYQYLVVLGHKSIYGSYENDSRVNTTIRPQWFPVFDTYNVDLVISGHDHMYCRTYKLHNGRATSNQGEERLIGTYYLDLGSSGDKTRVPDAKLSTDGLHECVLDLKGSNYSCGANIEVDDKKMQVTIYNQYGSVVDSFKIFAKRDPLTIDVSGFNKDSLIEDLDLQVTNTANKTGLLTFKNGDQLKYINRIQLLADEEVCLDTRVNYSARTYEYQAKNLTGLNYQLVFYLNDGSTVKHDISINYWQSANVHITGQESLDLVWSSNVASFGDYSWKVYVDDKLYKTLSANDLALAKVALRNDLLVGEHKVALDLLSDDKVIDSYNIDYQGKCNFTLEKELIEMNVGDKVDLEYEFDYDDLVKIQVEDPSIVKYENLEVVAYKAGETKILFTIRNSDIQYECKVVVNESKGGCSGKSKADILGLFSILSVAIILRKKHYYE